MREVMFEGKTMEEMNIEKWEVIKEKKVNKKSHIVKNKETEIDGKPTLYYIQNSVNIKG